MAAGGGILVIGVGNPYRNDDAVGLVVARRLKAQGLEGVTVLEHSGEGLSLMEAWQGAQAVILIDAVHAGAAPGALYRIEAHARPVPAGLLHYSTHAFSVAEAIELARALNQLPATCLVHGIEGGNFEAGARLSLDVEKAGEEVLRRVGQDIAALKAESQA